jgi:hypothetical protein
MTHVPSRVIALPVQQAYNETPELESFAPFSELPVEIRLHIWKIAVPRGRILRFNIDFNRNEYSIRGCFSRVPTIMHVCRESREVGLQDFRCGFPHLTPQNGGVYWSDSDTLLYLPSASVSWDYVRSFLNLGIHTFLPAVRHLALPINQKLLGSMNKRWMMELVRGLQKRDGLTTLTFILDPMKKLRRPYPAAIAFDEALDVPVYTLENHKLSSVEADIQKTLERLDVPTHRLPITRCLVAVPRKFKRSGFCVGMERVRPLDLLSEDESENEEEEEEAELGLRYENSFWNA